MIEMLRMTLNDFLKTFVWEDKVFLKLMESPDSVMGNLIGEFEVNLIPFKYLQRDVFGVFAASDSLVICIKGLKEEL